MVFLFILNFFLETNKTFPIQNNYNQFSCEPNVCFCEHGTADNGILGEKLDPAINYFEYNSK